MSQAIAQSATQLTVSNTSEENFDFALSVSNAAVRQAKGVTRERQMINRNKLVSAVCADFRNHFASIYGKTERLPSVIFAKCEIEVDTFLTKTLANVHPMNAISFRRAFFHNSREMEITERVVNTGENKLTLAEQRLGVILFIGQAEKRLKELEAKPTPDYDREKEIKAQILKLSVTKQFIEGEIAHQSKVTTETKS